MNWSCVMKFGIFVYKKNDFFCLNKYISYSPFFFFFFLQALYCIMYLYISHDYEIHIEIFLIHIHYYFIVLRFKIVRTDTGNYHILHSELSVRPMFSTFVWIFWSASFSLDKTPSPQVKDSFLAWVSSTQGKCEY